MTVQKTSNGEYQIIHNENEIIDAIEVTVALLKCNFSVRYTKENQEVFDLIKKELSKSSRKLSLIPDLQEPMDAVNLAWVLRIN